MLITFIYVRRWVIGISFALAGMVARAEFSAERMVLVEPRLEGAAADRVRHWQEAVRSEARDPVVAFEQLGWAYVKLGRESWDAGFFKLAELTAQVMEATEGPIPAAQLLKGHALVQMHRFAEAEELAQALVAQRGEPRDYALLADATMEQGKLAAAVAACQQFVNRYPGLESYARVAQLRWLHGDLAGTIAGGWPNGRRYGDDVIDIAVTAIISDLRTNPLTIRSADGIDNMSVNDAVYNKVFPYAGTPHNGRNYAHNPGAKVSPLYNLSTRGPVGEGYESLISGFVIRETEPVTILVRGLGPTLTSFGVEGALADPSCRCGSRTVRWWPRMTIGAPRRSPTSWPPVWPPCRTARRPWS